VSGSLSGFRYNLCSSSYLSCHKNPNSNITTTFPSPTTLKLSIIPKSRYGVRTSPVYPPRSQKYREDIFEPLTYSRSFHGIPSFSLSSFSFSLSSLGRTLSMGRVSDAPTHQRDLQESSQYGWCGLLWLVSSPSQPGLVFPSPFSL